MHDKVNAVKNRVNAARDVFQGIVQQEKSVALAKFLEEGGVKEEFDYQDQIEIKFFDAYKHYQKRRSEFVLGQEKIRQANLCSVVQVVRDEWHDIHRSNKYDCKEY